MNCTEKACELKALEALTSIARASCARRGDRRPDRAASLLLGRILRSAQIPNLKTPNRRAQQCPRKPDQHCTSMAGGSSISRGGELQVVALPAHGLCSDKPGTAADRRRVHPSLMGRLSRARSRRGLPVFRMDNQRHRLIPTAVIIQR